MNSVEIIELKPKRQPLSITLQIVFVIAVLVSGVITLFFSDWMPLLYATLTLTLATMAWNNYKIMKRKWIPILYLVFSVITFVSCIYGILEYL